MLPGAAVTPKGQVARLRKNLGHIMPWRPPQGSNEKAPAREATGTPTPGVEVHSLQRGWRRGRWIRALSRAAPSHPPSPGPQLSQRKFNDSASFRSNK